jgi:hypothetical protein
MGGGGVPVLRVVVGAKDLAVDDRCCCHGIHVHVLELYLIFFSCWCRVLNAIC